MLRLFNPIQILKMDNEVVEAIAAENKQTRDRRLALKDQKQAIEEAKSLCASLAMRSELRGQEDYDEGPDSDDEEAGRRNAGGYQQWQSGRGYEGQVPPSQARTPAQRDPRYEEPQQKQQQRQQQQVNGTHAQQRPAQPQEAYRQETPQYRPEPVSPVSPRHSRGDSARVSSEWAQNYYTAPAAAADAPQPPTSAPPPPPRPPKSDEEAEPRYGREGGRERDGKRESARHRIMGTLAR